MLTLVVLIAWTLAAFLWRRRGPLPPIPPPRPTAQTFHEPEMLARWANAGEHRIALDGWGWILARRMAESRDLEEIARIQQVLDDVADTVFSPKGPAYFAKLCRLAEEAATA